MTPLTHSHTRDAMRLDTHQVRWTDCCLLFYYPMLNITKKIQIMGAKHLLRQKSLNNGKCAINGARLTEKLRHFLYEMSLSLIFSRYLGSFDDLISIRMQMIVFFCLDQSNQNMHINKMAAEPTEAPTFFKLFLNFYFIQFNSIPFNCNERDQ